MPSFGMLHHVALVRTDVSDELSPPSPSYTAIFPVHLFIYLTAAWGHILQKHFLSASLFSGFMFYQVVLTKCLFI
jgi:hypothetical protein